MGGNCGITLHNVYYKKKKKKKNNNNNNIGEEGVGIPAIVAGVAHRCVLLLIA